MNVKFAGDFDLAGCLGPYRFYETLVGFLQHLTNASALAHMEAADV